MSEKYISIIGSGGHSRSIIALLENNNYKIKGIFDDSYEPDSDKMILSYKLTGKVSDIESSDNLVLAVGDNLLRAELFNKFYDQIVKENIVHASAIIENEVTMGHSNNIFALVFVNTCVIIGNNNIINSCCMIEHESKIGDNNHISINSTLGGRVTIGNNCLIGAGAIIRDQISITSNVIIGAGAVVVKDITEPGTYVGNPVVKIK